MSPGQPLTLSYLLPFGLTLDDVYVLIAALVSFLFVFTFLKTFLMRDKHASRIRALKERRAELRGEAISTKRKKRRNNQEAQVNWIKSIVTKLKLLQQDQIGKTTSFLVSAGYRSKDAIFIYTFLQLLSPIVLGIASYVLLAGKIETLSVQLLVTISGAYVGLKLPGVMVFNQRTKRHYAIQKSLSDTLDLLMICAEAGLSLSAALDRVSRELGLVYQEMSEELALTSIELGFLPDRKQALTNLAARVDMQEVRGIVNVLIQTEKYGTPIAQALRSLSAEFRTQRMLRAEQKAARLPAIMTVPMIVFILPTLFVIIIAPAIIQVLDTWK